jgi:hypothetical protein
VEGRGPWLSIVRPRMLRGVNARNGLRFHWTSLQIS